MGMNVGQGSGSGEPEVMMDINTTPLIDVMLVLLIMLIITIPAQLHSVNLDMPVSKPPTKKVDPVVIKKMISNTNITSTSGVVLIVPMISSSASDPTFMAMRVTPGLLAVGAEQHRVQVRTESVHFFHG